MQGFHIIPGTMTADAPSTDQSGIAIQLEMTVTFAPISSLTVSQLDFWWRYDFHLFSSGHEVQRIRRFLHDSDEPSDILPLQERHNRGNFHQSFRSRTNDQFPTRSRQQPSGAPWGPLGSCQHVGGDSIVTCLLSIFYAIYFLSN